MYSSLTNLANAALDHLGEKPIADIEAGGVVEQRLARNIYPALSLILMADPYEEAAVVANLMSVENDRTTEYLYKHQRQVDDLKLIELLDRTTNDVLWRGDDRRRKVVSVRMDRVGAFIYSPIEILAAKYVKAPTSAADALTYRPKLQEAVAWGLAARVARSTFKKTDEAQAFMRMAQAWIDDAFAHDQNEMPDQAFPDLADMHAARW